MGNGGVLPPEVRPAAPLPASLSLLPARGRERGAGRAECGGTREGQRRWDARPHRPAKASEWSCRRLSGRTAFRRTSSRDGGGTEELAMANAEESAGRREAWQSLRTNPDYRAGWKAHGSTEPVLEPAPFPLRVHSEADLMAARWGLLAWEDPRVPDGPLGGVTLGDVARPGVVDQPLGQRWRQHQVALGHGDEGVVQAVIPEARAAGLADALVMLRQILQPARAAAARREQPARVGQRAVILPAAREDLGQLPGERWSGRRRNPRCGRWSGCTRRSRVLRAESEGRSRLLTRHLLKDGDRVEGAVARGACQHRDHLAALSVCERIWATVTMTATCLRSARRAWASIYLVTSAVAVPCHHGRGASAMLRS